MIDITKEDRILLIIRHHPLFNCHEESLAIRELCITNGLYCSIVDNTPFMEVTHKYILSHILSRVNVIILRGIVTKKEIEAIYSKAKKYNYRIIFRGYESSVNKKDECLLDEKEKEYIKNYTHDVDMYSLIDKK
jgi:hypothetical protein